MYPANYDPVSIAHEGLKTALGPHYTKWLLAIVIIVVVYMMCSGGLVGSIGSEGSSQYHMKEKDSDNYNVWNSSMASVPQCVRLGADSAKLSWENFGCMGNQFARTGAFDQTSSNRNLVDVTGADLGFYRVDNPQFGNAYNLVMDNYLAAGKADRIARGSDCGDCCEGLVPDRRLDYVPAGSGRYGGSTSTWGQWVNKHPLTALAALKASDTAWGDYSKCNNNANNPFKFGYHGVGPVVGGSGLGGAGVQNYVDNYKAHDEGTLAKMAYTGGN